MAARCALCGRLLADPASRARGLGPVCFRRSGGRPGPRALRPRPPGAPGVPVPEIPGQAELPLSPRQTSLWSP